MVEHRNKGVLQHRAHLLLQGDSVNSLGINHIFSSPLPHTHAPCPFSAGLWSGWTRIRHYGFHTQPEDSSLLSGGQSSLQLFPFRRILTPAYLSIKGLSLSLSLCKSATSCERPLTHLSLLYCSSLMCDGVQWRMCLCWHMIGRPCLLRCLLQEVDMSARLLSSSLTPAVKHVHIYRPESDPRKHFEFRWRLSLMAALKGQ